VVVTKQLDSTSSCHTVELKTLATASRASNHPRFRNHLQNLATRFERRSRWTGPLTNAEVAVRSSTGVYLFVPQGYDESVIAQWGLRLLVCEDETSNMAKVAKARHDRDSSNLAPWPGTDAF
jgi:hypothetical protein